MLAVRSTELSPAKLSYIAKPLLVGIRDDTVFVLCKSLVDLAALSLLRIWNPSEKGSKLFWEKDLLLVNPADGRRP